MSEDEKNMSDRWCSFFPKSGTEDNALNVVIYLSITVKHIQLCSMNLKFVQGVWRNMRFKSGLNVFTEISSLWLWLYLRILKIAAAGDEESGKSVRNSSYNAICHHPKGIA
jgi:hypothetical protein